MKMGGLRRYGNRRLQNIKLIKHGSLRRHEMRLNRTIRETSRTIHENGWEA